MVCVSFSFGSKITPFQPKMVEPSAKNLDSAFKWFIRQPCAGSRKFMDAFRFAIENEEERKNGIGNYVYLFHF